MKFWHKSRAITLVQICQKGCVTIKLDLVNINAYINFVKIYQFILKILSGNNLKIYQFILKILSGNKIMMDKRNARKRKSYIAPPPFQSGAIIK